MPTENHTPPHGQIVRLRGSRDTEVRILVDGMPTLARAGDTVLVAVLAAGHLLRRSEFDGQPRAGFCLMGTCQDCWMWTADGMRIRACTTRVAEALAVLTQPPENWPHGWSPTAGDAEP